MLAAARTLMQIVPRAGWAFGFMHSVLVGEFASVESTSSLLSSNRFSVSPFYLLAADIYLASTRAWLHVRVCTGLPRNARQYRPICIWEAALQAVSNFRIEHRASCHSPLSSSFIPRAVYVSGRCFQVLPYVAFVRTLLQNSAIPPFRHSPRGNLSLLLYLLPTFRNYFYPSSRSFAIVARGTLSWTDIAKRHDSKYALM